MEAVEEVAEIVGDQESDQGYVGLYGYKGCLISDVSWYSSGTCATFTSALLQVRQCGGDNNTPKPYSFNIRMFANVLSSH